MLAIEVEGLQKRYGGGWSRSGRGGQLALRGVDLTLPRGSAFGLLGPNGAGKTTFIKALLGIVRPTAGSIRLLGGSPEDPSIRARIGYLPERLELPGSWRPMQFLHSVARLKGLAAREAERDAAALLDRVGLWAERERKVAGFSKGMRQRLGLAAALLGKPELLILDEPTDGLDPLARVSVRALLLEELARGASLLLNSHLLSETERVCRRIGILVDGRLVVEGPLDALCTVADQWETRFAPGGDGASLESLGFAPHGTPDVRRFSGDSVALNTALARAREQGALLVELVRVEKSLEEVLAEAMRTQGSGAAGAGARGGGA